MTIDPTPPPTDSPCPPWVIQKYRAYDARISIGLPIKQDNGEFEWPGYLDGILIAFYPNIHDANLALWNLLDAPPVVLDLDFVSVGWAE